METTNSRLLNLEGKSIAILAMGLSHQDYILSALSMGGKKMVADEVWGINSVGGSILVDRLFLMDDLKLMEELSYKDQEKNGPLMGYETWMKTAKFPIITSKAYPESFPSSIEYPLEEVLNELTIPYFNNTVAYALGYAICTKPEIIHLFGCDFTYQDRHVAEKGRACVEYWIRVAMERGIKVGLATHTTLMDCVYGQPLYGYRQTPIIERVDGKIKVKYETN